MKITFTITESISKETQIDLEFPVYIKCSGGGDYSDTLQVICFFDAERCISITKTIEDEISFEVEFNGEDLNYYASLFGVGSEPRLFFYKLATASDYENIKRELIELVSKFPTS